VHAAIDYDSAVFNVFPFYLSFHRISIHPTCNDSLVSLHKLDIEVTHVVTHES